MKAVLDRITDALVAGDRVELRCLGAFTVAERGARTGRNPATGELVSVETQRLLVFNPSRLMHARLNPWGTVISAEMGAEVERLLRV